jgi:glycosyltransferase involved in cell wall biosynthesis
MRRAFQREEADGVVMTGHNMAGFAALAGMECKRRLLWMHFHHRGVKPEWQWKAIYGAARRLFPRIAFCADFIREEAEAIDPGLRGVSVTLPNPFPLPALPTREDRQAARRLLDIPEGVRVVGNAGWLIERKRWDVFLKAAVLVAEKERDVVFLACGDGPMRGELERMAGELGLEGRVRWLGWQKDLTAFYLALDVLLFNAEWDAQPRTPLEAGSYEVPTVASVAHGGLKEVIRSEKIGFLTAKHDAEWLADRVVALLEDDELRKRMGEACRRVLEERHDPLDHARAVLGLLGLNGHA